MRDSNVAEASRPNSQSVTEVSSKCFQLKIFSAFCLLSHRRHGLDFERGHCFEFYFSANNAKRKFDHRKKSKTKLRTEVANLSEFHYQGAYEGLLKKS